jgi:hypothetical protein
LEEAINNAAKTDEAESQQTKTSSQKKTIEVITVKPSETLFTPPLEKNVKILLKDLI